MAISLYIAVLLGTFIKVVPLCFGILKVAGYRSFGAVLRVAIAVFAVQVFLEFVLTGVLFGGLGILFDYSSVFILSSYLLTQAPISHLQVAGSFASFVVVLSVLVWCNRFFMQTRTV